MKRRVRIEWIADDGTVFENRLDCEKYECKDKVRYCVTYRTILEYSDEVAAYSEEQAIQQVSQLAPPNDEWTEISTEVTCVKCN